jgi:hypothetical protein
VFSGTTGLASLVAAGAVLTAVGCSLVFGTVSPNSGIGAIAVVIYAICRSAIAAFFGIILVVAGIVGERTES